MALRIKFIILSNIFILGIGAFAEAAPFEKNVPYQQTILDFLDAITAATSPVKDPNELNDIDAWEQSSRESLPDFLTDLITIAQQLEENGDHQFIYEQYSAFASKWNSISATYPGLQELEPIISPIIDQLLAGLPQLKPPSSDNPISGLYDLYKELEAQDPWRLGGLFLINPLPDTNKEIRVTQLLDETKKKGIKKTNIISRETSATINGVVVYFELMQDGEITQRFVNYRDPTIIHETLEAIKIYHADPVIISVLEDMVAVIDLNLQTALNNGILDECSYRFIYKKTDANLPAGCTDKEMNAQNFVALSKFDPFDDVNQVKLSEPEELLISSQSMNDSDRANLPLVENKQLTNEILTNYQQGFGGTATTFFMGVVFPTYILSLIGLFKGL